MYWVMAILPFALLLLGFPIFLLLLITSLVILIAFFDVPMTVVHQIIFNSLNKYALLAVPFFVFAGDLMSRGGISVRLLRWVASLVGVGALVRSGVGWKVRGALPAVVPESFAMAVADRLAALSTPARGVVELATELGERFDWRLVACGCREPRHRLWPAPSRLADLNITVPDEGQHDRSIWPSDSPT